MTYKEKVAWLQRYLKAREKANFLGGCVQEMEAEAQGMRIRLDGMPGIMTVRDRPGQEVLRRRYMNGESYAEICDALALVERRVYQLHRLGVNKVCEPENGG